MKKFAVLSLFLCAALLMQCFAVPAAALAEPDTTPVSAIESTGAAEETVPPQVSQIPFGQVSILNGCRTIEGMSPLAGSERKLDTAMAAFVYEMNTDTVVYAYNPDTKMSPGTLAKAVLALVVVEQSKLDETVTCQPGIQSKVPGSSRSVGLKSEEQLTVEDLLYCLLLQGANDAAVALAEHVAGSRDGCVELMNQRVRQIGCGSTEFGNISGLDTATSYTTARDMAKIARVVLKNETLLKIMSALEYKVPATNLAEERKLRTENYLIDDLNVAKYYDNRVKGGLASYSEASGANLFCTTKNKDESMELILVVLGCMRQFNPEPKLSWQVINYGNFDEMVDLIEYIYGSFKVNRIVYDGQAMNLFPVVNGECDVVGQPTVNIDTVLPASVHLDNMDIRYTARDGGLSAPISKGDQIATVELWYRNSCVAEAELFAMGNVKTAEDTGVSFLNESIGGSDGVSGFFGFVGTVVGLALGAFGLYVAYNAYRRAQRRAQRRRRRAERRRSW